MRIRRWENWPSSPHSYSHCWCSHPPVLQTGRRCWKVWKEIPTTWIFTESENTVGMFIGGIWVIIWNHNLGICLRKHINKVIVNYFGIRFWVFPFTKNQWVWEQEELIIYQIRIFALLYEPKDQWPASSSPPLSHWLSLVLLGLDANKLRVTARAPHP